MKRKTLYLFLAAEGAALIALAFFADSFSTLFSSLLAFPFEQIGSLLGALSLKGRVGNGLALAVLAGISAIPLLFALKCGKGREKTGEKFALLLTAIALALTLWCMADPSRISAAVPGMGKEALPVLKAVLGGTVWSMMICCAVLRLLRLFKAGGREQLYSYLRYLLYALCAMFVGAAAFSLTEELLSNLRETQLALDGLFAVLRFLAGALPYALDVAVTLAALTLLEALLGEDGEKTDTAAQKLSGLCCLSLAVTTVSAALLNVLQVALSKHLSGVAASVTIPIVSLAFVLGALLLSRLLIENRRLRDENNAFI